MIISLDTISLKILCQLIKTKHTSGTLKFQVSNHKKQTQLLDYITGNTVHHAIVYQLMIKQKQPITLEQTQVSNHRRQEVPEFYYGTQKCI